MYLIKNFIFSIAHLHFKNKTIMNCNFIGGGAGAVATKLELLLENKDLYEKIFINLTLTY